MIAGINEILAEDAQIITLVGLSGDKTKVYPIVAPVGASFPYVTTSLAQYSPTHSKQEANNIDFPQVAINVHADSYDSLDAISERVIAIFDVSGFTTDAGYTFEKTWVVNVFDRPEMFTADHPAYVRTVVVGVILRR